MSISMFLFEKENKKKARRKPLSTPKLAHIANEHEHEVRLCKGAASQCGGRGDLGTICKVVHFFFQLSLNCTQGFHRDPKFLLVGCVPSAARGLLKGTRPAHKFIFICQNKAASPAKKAPLIS